MRRLGTRARANDPRFLGAPAPGAWEPELRVSVILPVYRAQEALERTVAALERQTYPSHLVEVLPVDDGSDPPIVAPAFAGDLRLLRQERDGFGAGRARNLGAHEATGDILLFLDADMIPERTWVEGHARWHHLSDDFLTVGRRRHIDEEWTTPEAIRGADRIADLFADQDAPHPPWLEAHFARTNGLLDDTGDLFRVVTSGNLGVSKLFFDALGGFDDSFNEWGGEDVEFGYRAYTSGALIVLDDGASCFHQGPGLEPDSAESITLRRQRAKMAHLLAHPGFRKDAPGRSYRVPRLTVLVDGGDRPGDHVVSQVAAVLASDFHDLVVGVTASDDEALDWVHRTFDGDPRYCRDADLMVAHPFAQLRLELPEGLEVGDRVVRRLVNAASSGSVVTVETSLGQIRLAHTRALERVEGSPSPWEDAATVFGHKEIRAFDLDLSEASTGWSERLPTPARKVMDRFSGIRSWHDLTVTMRWLGAGLRAVVWGRLRSRLGIGAWRRLGLEGAEVARRGTPPLPGLYSTGGEGFDPLPQMIGERVDLAYGTTPPSDRLLGRIEEAGGMFLQLDEGPNPLAVPPFDPKRYHPKGWSTAHDGEDRLLTRIPEPDPDLRSHRSVRIPAPTNATEAARVAALTGGGVVLAAAGPGEWDGWLGPELAEAILDVGDLDDALTREHASVRQRRAAHLHHSTHARRTQLRQRAGLPDPGTESVSVLLVTNRPHLVGEALGRITSQRFRPTEVVLGLHGITALGDLEQWTDGVPVRVVSAPADAVFGDVLNECTLAASGGWIAKMDDDDHYGRDHLGDLIAAARYSGAQVVGKGAEFIHLAQSGTTIRRLAGEPESASRTISGGAFAVRRDALTAVGGWARVRRGVDQTLFTAVLDAGGFLYRTHGFGFVLERRGSGHTWETDDAYFEKQAMARFPGLERCASGLSD